MTKTKVSIVKLCETLNVATASVRDGIITVRRSFYYTHGKTTEHLINDIREQFPRAEVVDSGEVWKAFRGGAPIAQQSHWFVKFRPNLEEPKVDEQCDCMDCSVNGEPTH